MPRLLRDRYFEYANDRAFDLATGEPVIPSALPGEPCRRERPVEPLGEVLDHGRDGTPRWIVADDPGVDDSPVGIHRVADEARARGFVPIAADVYFRVRDDLAEDLRDRALVLIARPSGSPIAGRTALLDAAARSPRPHVLVTFREATETQPWRSAAAGGMVHEARAVYGAQPLPPAAPRRLPEDVVYHVARGSRAGEFARGGRHAAAERLLRDVAAALVRRRAFRPAADACLALGRLLLERGRASDAEATFAAAADHASSARDEAAGASARIWQAAARTDAAQLTAAESLCRAVLVVGGLDAAERARAEATLARVLVWQGRLDEAGALPFVSISTGAGAGGAFVAATAVRVLLAHHRIFDAGLRARQLLTASEAGADPLDTVIALAAHLRFLIAAGDLTLAQERLVALECAAREARAPLRLARLRLLWVDALRRSGRDREAAHELRYLDRVRAAAPPALRAEIERRLRGPRGAEAETPAAIVSAPRLAPAATTLVSLVQQEDDDRAALERALKFTAAALQASRIDLWSSDAGPATVVVSAGSGLSTRLGSRVLEAGIAIGPEPSDAAGERGVPVRLGSRLLAGLVSRWPADTAPPPEAAELLALTAAVAAPRVESLLAAARAECGAATAIPELVGASPAIDLVRTAVTRAAAAPFAVLVEGESGVGKELVARAIHQLSPRRERRFCDVNCAALPEELLESELFGHARGAFTGAVTDRAGLFEEADGGTVFLDEVIDLSARAQAKLLRVLQQQEVRRVGETFSRRIDVRVVCAANRDLREETASGRFRQDLLYRLDVIRIRIPPLRERPEDIPALAEHFWRGAAARLGTTATLTHGVLTALARYHWPGNVRELQNVIAALAVEAPARGQVRAGLLPVAITGAAAVTSARLADARAQFERRFVEMALARAAGSRTRAARELGVSRQGLLKLMARLGMQ